MKPGTAVRITAGRRNVGWQGYLLEPHANLPGHHWCRLSEKAPHPVEFGLNKMEWKDLIVHETNLTAV